MKDQRRRDAIPAICGNVAPTWQSRGFLARRRGNGLAQVAYDVAAMLLFVARRRS
jgi:hypothetical protein